MRPRLIPNWIELLCSEKERYEESIKQLLDEAEHQMSLSTEKIKKSVRTRFSWTIVYLF